MVNLDTLSCEDAALVTDLSHSFIEKISRLQKCVQNYLSHITERDQRTESWDNWRRYIKLIYLKRKFFKKLNQQV